MIITNKYSHKRVAQMEPKYSQQLKASHPKKSLLFRANSNSLLLERRVPPGC